jgi:hypothetical protein
MDFYEALSARAVPVNIEPSNTSYFSKPEIGLDPRLFRNNKLIPAVRSSVLTVLFNYLDSLYKSSNAWTFAWLAGSGVSHQWAAKRLPGDLDCLVGINYEVFRSSNLQFTGLSNQEIASMLNEGFRTDLWPLTDKFMDAFELTFYVNVQTDLSKIKPYAAYSLIADDWLVQPTMEEAPTDPSWNKKIEKDKSQAADIIARYATALTHITNAPNTAMRINAERALRMSVKQASELYEEIHKGRKYAFSEDGSGYLDFANYRWQAGKESGIVQALGKLKEIADLSDKDFAASTYGVELPDVSTLIRRAATRNN